MLAPQLRRVLGDVVEHPQRRVAGAPGVVLMGDRRPEDGHDPVAGEFVDRSLVAVDGLGEDREEALHGRPPLLGVLLLGHVHRALDVGEEHRDELALALGLDSLGDSFTAMPRANRSHEASYTEPRPIDWSVNRRAKEIEPRGSLRAAAVQLNSTDDRARNLVAAERLVRAAAADGADLVALPEKWNLLAAGERLLAGAEPLDGPSLTAARGWAPSSASTCSPAASPSGGGERASNTSVLIGPDGADLAVYRKIHMFDVDVGGVTYRESEFEDPGEEIVTASLGEADSADRLLRPPLPRALPDPGAARRPPDLGPLGLHRADRPRPLGGAAAGPRDREPGLRDRPEPDRRGAAALRLLRALGDRRSLGEVLAVAPDEECFVAADLDLAAQDGSASRCPRSPTAGPRPMPGRS